MKMPLLSIVTPVYNTEDYVDRCFDSLVNQSYNNIEIIVVNNGSSGNIDEIFENYKDKYLNRKFKLVKVEKNKGLINGYLAGAKIATGDYIAFIDSDDRVSYDYYRRLIETAENTNADMVASDFVYEYDDNSMIIDGYNSIRSFSFCMEDEQILEFFMEQSARAFYWNLMWNKVYSCELWKKAEVYLEESDVSIVFAQDIVFSLALYAFSKKYVNIHDVNYYYYKRRGSETDGEESYSKFLRQINDLEKIFTFFKWFLVKIGREDLLPQRKEWMERYHRFFCDFIFYSKLPRFEKKRLYNQINKVLEVNEFKHRTSDDDFFQRFQTPYNDTMEKIRREIHDKKHSVISFDIFDTLIVRPFWEPKDLFELLSKFYNEKNNIKTYIDFAKYRIMAEENIKKYKNSLCNGEECTLAEIYDYIHEVTSIPKKQLDQVMLEEQRMEEKYCYLRKTGKILFDYACALNKTVILTSDMYLPKNVIEEILSKNNISGYAKLYLSSELLYTKATGKLFDYVSDDLGVQFKNIVHIGDNYNTDIVNARKKGIVACHIPKAQDVMSNRISVIDTNNMYSEMFENTRGLVADIRLQDTFARRTMNAVVANKIYDDPFASIKYNTQFNADPYYVGYFVLGRYILGCGKWIKELVKKQKYDKAVFVARDGYLIWKAYEMMKDVYELPDCGYLHASRNALIPLMLTEEFGNLSFTHFLYYANFSPKSIFEKIKIISSLSAEEMQELCKKNNIIWTSFFNSEQEIIKFLDIFKKNAISIEAKETYREKMKSYFSKQVPENACTIDIGYSARLEVFLSNLLRYKVDAVMLYCDEEKCRKNSINQDFSIFSMNNYFPGFDNEMVIELIISSIAPYCSGYEFDGGVVKPKFRHDDVNFCTKVMVNIMHSAAMSFIRDYFSIFGNDAPLDDNYYNYSWPMEYFLKYAPQEDYAFLSEAYLDEAKWTGKTIRIIDNRLKYVCRENTYQKLESVYYSNIRRLADKIFPKGTRRREALKKIMPKKGSKNWRRIKFIYNKLGGR